MEWVSPIVLLVVFIALIGFLGKPALLPSPSQAAHNTRQNDLTASTRSRHDDSTITNDSQADSYLAAVGLYDNGAQISFVRQSRLAVKPFTKG